MPFLGYLNEEQYEAICFLINNEIAELYQEIPWREKDDDEPYSKDDLRMIERYEILKSIKEIRKI